MTFSLTVSLDVAGRRAVVVGGGREAVVRVGALLDADARVTVITPDPAEALVALADTGAIRLLRRGYHAGDVTGAFLAYVTREDLTPVEAVWQEANDAGVLLSTLDDVPRCHFATPAVLRRGDLAVTIATGGRSPALAKRLRRHLEDEFGPELGELVEVVDAARQACLPRTAPFAEWAARFEVALADLDGLLAQLRAGRHDAVRDQLVRTLRTPTDVALPCDVDAPDAAQVAAS